MSTVFTIAPSPEPSLVAVRCAVTAGRPGIGLTGWPEEDARQAGDRIAAALRAAGLALPPQRLQITFAPATQGVVAGFDLAIVLAILGATGALDAQQPAGWVALGALDERGALGDAAISPAVVREAERAGKGLVGGMGLAPFAQAGAKVLACPNLGEAIRRLRRLAPVAALRVAEPRIGEPALARTPPAPTAPAPAQTDEPPSAPPRTWWSRLFGSRVAEAPLPARAFPDDDEAPVPPIRQGGRDWRARREPHPEFHGIGHRARLRARLIEGGADALADYEVLEFMLFGARRRGDTKPVAKALIKRFGSLPAVLNADPTALMSVPGVGEASVGVIKIGAVAALRMARAQLRDQPVLGTWHALIDYLSIDMAHLTRERVRVLYLDTRNRLIRDEHVSEGTIDEASVHPREVIHHALDAGACGLILVHNHPSGDPEPSQDDIRLTNRIAEAGRLVGITVLDHVVIGRSGHVSLRAKGLI